MRVLLLLFFFLLSGCTLIQRSVHMYGSEAPSPLSFHYKDCGSSIYYTFTVGDASKVDTLLFFYGATGCPSWKAVMPSYVGGLTVNARIFVLNKRFVPDRSTGLFGCGQEFHLANNPEQWSADYSEFIVAQIGSTAPTPRNIVLVGVSEGALTATKVAGSNPAVTHLAIIGSGGYSMRKSLSTLREKGLIWFDVESGWKKIATDSRSIEKSWYGNPYRWWSDVMDIEPLPDFLKLYIPILVGIGEQDESVPVDSARFLESKFKEAGKNNLTLRVYPAADHRLNAAGTSYRGEFFAELSDILLSSVK
ncbi:hydrolase or acyltransferase, alpha/beta fold family [Geotalea daltonii FRC-32]|uniref:Hydrolase or acyltransferase, alpha/beta fold family n=1 Tax=Geotalea daltonii (strain DSM 22248 / JCM 15807 / FRC-32) TaxID=316067 RepID=B9M204_GEODF|nr:prolyl oligopeptidase family serine peptidase [Geotalea daltonii]ACM19300.1 hydrolase or acyltransferase, alpha/beta fold family [Geotalea daltonii FRC-32]